MFNIFKMILWNNYSHKTNNNSKRIIKFLALNKSFTIALMLGINIVTDNECFCHIIMAKFIGNLTLRYG